MSEKLTNKIQNRIGKHYMNLGTKPICHKIKSPIRWYKGYCAIIFRPSQMHTPKPEVKCKNLYEIINFQISNASTSNTEIQVDERFKLRTGGT